MKKTVMVTGGAGMIGSNLVKRLVKEGWDVYVTDNLWRGKTEYLLDQNGKYVIDLDTHFLLKDLSIFEQCEECIGFTDYVVHLADIVAGIEYVFANQGELFRVNNLINSNLFAAARKHSDKIKGLLYAGTVCSFPLTLQNTYNPGPLHEDDLFPAQPESAYGWSKLIGQLEIGFLEKETSIPCCTLMFHNVYGTPTDYGPRSQVIPALIRKAVNYPDESFTVWGSGNQSRAFIHVNDIVEALMLALDKGWGHGWIQIGPSCSTTIREIAFKISEISGKGLTPVFDMTKPEGDSARYADYTKANTILGWEPKTNLDDGLHACYEWIENRILADKKQKKSTL